MYFVLAVLLHECAFALVLSTEGNSNERSQARALLIKCFQSLVHSVLFCIHPDCEPGNVQENHLHKEADWFLTRI